jgi:putative endonuclease
MFGYVYILKNLKNHRYYIGSTNNLKRRLEEHNRGKTSSLKHLRPLKLLFKQKYANLIQAKRIEYKLKKLKRKDIIERIIEERKIILKV